MIRSSRRISTSLFSCRFCPCLNRYLVNSSSAFDESDLRAEIDKITKLYVASHDDVDYSDKMEIDTSEGKPPDPRS